MWIATAVVLVLVAAPSIYGLLVAPKGASYLGYPYNPDDHMVYAAWIHQAAQGHFFFDNRFTTDPQPGLTVHLYFWLLGQIARVTGIPLAAALGRLVASALFVPLLYQVVRRVTTSVFSTRLAISLAILGGGIGFLVWQNFGVAIDNPSPLAPLLGGKLPIDVWQPEAFVFPSMLTNGLFMASLCLILFVFRSFLDAKEGWRPVLGGAVALGVLMNIHSYDVLMIAFVMVGFLVTQLVARDVDRGWLARAAVIATGAVIPALWFVYVLRHDAVFQARAATLTYSPDFRQVFFGYALMMILAIPGLWVGATERRQRLGVGLLILLIAALYAGSFSYTEGYLLNAPLWALVAVGGLVALGLMARENPAFNLILSWAVMGLVAIYFPALFQRKLAMGLAAPWAILAAMGFARFLRDRDRNARNLATILVLLVLSASSIRWFFREKAYIDEGVPNSTVHPIFLGRDEREILRQLEDDPRSRIVAIAMPGLASQYLDQDRRPIPDRFGPPAMPDLNPIVSGLAGAYTYAGHWSETPDYGRRRAQLSAIYDARTPPEERSRLIEEIKPDYIIQPDPKTFGFEIADLTPYGEVIYPGTRFELIRVKSQDHAQ